MERHRDAVKACTGIILNNEKDMNLQLLNRKSQPPYRIRWCICFSCVVVMLVLTSALLYNMIVRMNAPILVIECVSNDLGEGEVGDELQGSFNLKNVGGRALSFNLRAGCNCTSLKPLNGSVRPGEVQVIQVGLRVRDKVKAEKVSIEIRTNDPDNQSASMSFVAQSKTLVPIAPSEIDFGKILSSNGAQTTVKVTKVLNEGPTIIVNDSFLSAVEKTSNEKEIEYTVSVAKDAPLGRFVSSMSIKYENEPVFAIAIKGIVYPKVFATPNSLALTGRNDAVRFLISHFDGEALGDILRIEKPTWIELNSAKQSKSHYILEFSVYDVPDRTQKLHLIRVFFRDHADPAVIKLWSF